MNGWWLWIVLMLLLAGACFAVPVIAAEERDAAKGDDE